MDPLICEIAVPDTDDVEASWVMRGVDEITHEEAVEALGTPDFFVPLARQLPALRDQQDRWTVRLVAVEGLEAGQLPRGPQGLPQLSWQAAACPTGGRVLGQAWLQGGITDNQQVGNLGVTVARAHRRLGVGSALLAAAHRIAVAHGVEVLQSWANHHPAGPGEQALVPPTGAGTLRVDAAARFALAHGFALEQCEQHSVCELPGELTRLDQLWREALPAASGYRFISILDAIPDEWAASCAALLEHFTHEVPNAGMEAEPQHWDVERLRRGEGRRAAAGRRTVTTLAVHEATGEVVASTDICTDASHQEVCFQEITIVHAAHRGHRLGVLTKIQNHRQVHEHFPERQRIHTWNAGENAWMLAVNEQLGFRPALVEGAWQKRL